MWSIYLAIFFQIFLPTYQQFECSATGIRCITTTEYQLCSMVDGQISLIGDAANCPSGEICDSSGIMPCKVGTATTTTAATTTTSATTTTTTAATTTTTSATEAATGTPPTCTEEASYPGPQCNQYYECIFVMWWYDYKLYTCPTGQAFDQTTSQCQNSTTCV